MVGWEGGICAVEVGDKVVLEGLYGALAMVVSVVTGGCDLVGKVFGLDFHDEGIGYLIIKAMEHGCDTCMFQVVKEFVVGPNKFAGVA